MPRSEIDDIFASKSAPRLADLAAISSKAKGKAKAPEEDTSATTKKKKTKKRKEKTLQDTSTDTADHSSAVSDVKRKLEPETVFDPSTALPAPAKRLKTAKDSSTGPGKTKKENDDDKHKFRDSRGTGPRRKTDDGFSIYKEDELNIRDGGGDTPLCPFDCDCCF